MSNGRGVIEVPVDRLRLDPDNPRLPEDLQGGSQSEILQYMFENAVLDELARSFIDNGFFPHEPLLVYEANDEYIVLEGNRRLAALMVLLEHPGAQEADLSFVLDEPVTAAQLEGLRLVPALVVESRDEVRKYLGFRHIGGIKTWSAEAKARYLADEVEREIRRASDSPFADVARRVGSNTQGVRNAFIAMTILRRAKSEFGLETTHVQYRRFGVWLRAMNSPQLRSYIGFGDAKTHSEVVEASEGLNEAALREVLADMTPRDADSKPLLADSRDVTMYAKILTHERAHQALRRYRDFVLARQIIEQDELPDRIRQLINTIEVIITEVHRSEATSELAQVAEELFAISQSLLGVARIRAESAA